MYYEDTLRAIKSLYAIPPEVLASAGEELPAADTVGAGARDLITSLPDGSRARVTFIKTLTTGCEQRWFWTPYSAEILPLDSTGPRIR